MIGYETKTTMRLDEITVLDRHRRELGDLTSLAASIADKGLLHPVVVTADGRLVAGQRRMEACRSLGWDAIPVTVADTLTEARALLEAERDENTCRLDMAPSEKVALGLALEALERPAAAERKATAGKANLPTSEENFPSLTRGERTGKVYDLVGEAVGMSGPTYKRAKAVVREAETGDPAAVEALAEMDATGKVTPAYNKLTSPPPPPARVNSKPEEGKRLPLAIVRVASTLDDLIASLEGIAFKRSAAGLSSEERLAAIESFRKAGSRFSTLAGHLAAAERNAQ